MFLLIQTVLNPCNRIREKAARALNYSTIFKDNFQAERDYRNFGVFFYVLFHPEDASQAYSRFIAQLRY
jgi:hypothetical protein